MSPKRVLILVGVSGAGKSSWARWMLGREPRSTVVVSADDHFLGSDDVYRYQWEGRVQRAHIVRR